MAQPMLAWGGILVAWFLMGRIFSPTLGFAVGLLYLGVGLVALSGRIEMDLA
jgi:hypothetical protein